MEPNRAQSPWCGYLRNVVLVALGLGLGIPTGALARLVVDTGPLAVSVDTVWAEEGGLLWVGSVEQGQSLSLMMRIQNRGPASFTIDEVASEGESFFAHSPPFELPGFAARTLRVVFRPLSVGPHIGAVVIRRSDLPEPVIRIPLSGTSTPPLVLNGISQGDISRCQKVF